MADATGWTAEQWDRVNAAVRETFQKASVTSQFLPHYGPMPDSAAFVRTQFLKYGEQGEDKPVKSADRPTQTSDDTHLVEGPVSVADDETTKLFTFRVIVELSSEQVADTDLSSALLAFRRAASILARTEDLVFFRGGATGVESEHHASPNATAEDAKTKTPPSSDKKKDFRRFIGRQPAQFQPLTTVDAENRELTKSFREAKDKEFGQRLITAVVDAITRLEDSYHAGPFACVLDNKLFEEAHRPNEGSLVLPADRIKPLLNGPLLRSGDLAEDTGIVVALAGGDIDVVVGTPPSVQFLQVSMDAKYCFRVYAKTVLRIKDKNEPAVVTLFFKKS